MDIVGLFEEVSSTMQSDLEKARKAIGSNPGMKGSSFENTFREFLRKYLPKSLDVSTGSIIDSKGNQSKQLDVIISDAAKTPILYESEGIRVLPVEPVYAAIEVKAFMDKAELDRIFENMKSVRTLEKTAYLPKWNGVTITHTVYGREWNILPINYYVFAFDSVDLVTIAEHMRDTYSREQLPLWSRIDTIGVLGKGVICNRWTNGKHDAHPAPGSTIDISVSKRALLIFYTLVAHYLNQADMPYFLFNEYVANLPLR